MTHPHVIALNDDNFEAEVLERGATLPILVDFAAEWCPPCKVLRPIIEQLAEAYAGRLRVAEVDIDASPLVVRRLAIRGAPTIVLFRGGEPVARQLGSTTRARLLTMCGLS
jgi:thioredoxin 1